MVDIHRLAVRADYGSRQMRPKNFLRVHAYVSEGEGVEGGRVEGAEVMT